MIDTSELDELTAEQHAIRWQFRSLAVASLSMLGGGAIFFHFTEHFRWIDAFYFCTMTLTTVGYGDITPRTDGGKLFDIFYVLAGVGIIATFASVLVKNANVRRQVRVAKRQHRTEKRRLKKQ